jgi:sucrose phosphorylase
MKNQVQLITYVDRLGGGGLRELQALVSEGGALAHTFGGVHLLPFFHPIDGADAGFDPIDHTQVDPRLGGWADVQRLTQTLDVMGDVIVNHVSSASPQFADYAAKGDASPHAGLFLTFDAVFPNGASESDLLALYRPRPGLPVTAVTLAGGQRRLLWTTFTPQQLDIAVLHPQGRAYLHEILRTFSSNGIRQVRLDAVGYAIKKAGTSSFMLPETFDFIHQFAAQARALGIEVLVEIHAHYQRQIDIARQVDWVYDFALPPLVLHALFFKTAAPLKRWIGIRPNNALTVLDTHDGIGIIDIGADAQDRAGKPGLVPPQELDALVERIHANSGGQSRKATGAAASNLDLYQVNCTFFDALGRNQAAYLLARAIQFFMPGVPQVYYVGLLAGENDMSLLEQTGVGRDINRQRFSLADIQTAVQKPVVQRLLELIQLRNSHPAFGGQFSVVPAGDGVAGTADQHLVLRWQQGSHVAELHADLALGRGHLETTQAGQVQVMQLG